MNNSPVRFDAPTKKNCPAGLTLRRKDSSSLYFLVLLFIHRGTVGLRRRRCRLARCDLRAGLGRRGLARRGTLTGRAALSLTAPLSAAELLSRAALLLFAPGPVITLPRESVASALDSCVLPDSLSSRVLFEEALLPPSVSLRLRLVSSSVLLFRFLAAVVSSPSLYSRIFALYFRSSERPR